MQRRLLNVLAGGYIFFSVAGCSVLKEVKEHCVPTKETIAYLAEKYAKEKEEAPIDVVPIVIFVECSWAL